MNKPRWRKVNSRRNSECGSARLETLDWSSWWTDTIDGDHYLHVASTDGETVHRVYCRCASSCRLGMRDGVLYWIIDRFEQRE